MSRKLIGNLAGAAVLAAAILAVFFYKRKPAAEEAAPLVRPLKTVVVGERVEALRGQYAGRVKAAQRVEMGFEVPGMLAEKLVKRGDRVKQGQVLARLDARDFQNDLAAARANLERTRAFRERMREATAKNAVSKQELDNAVAADEIARVELNIKQKALEDTVLTAVFDGIIADTYVDNYQNVQAKQAILSLQDISSLDIVVSVPEQRVAATKKGEQSAFRHTAVFDYFPGREFAVVLKEFSTEADPVTQTFAATFALEIPENQVIMPGMTATVLEYATADSQAGTITLPLDLVPTASQGGYFVWKLKPRDDGMATVERQPVEVGRLDGDELEITSGLAVGDRVAGAGVGLLRHGQIVRPLEP